MMVAVKHCMLLFILSLQYFWKGSGIKFVLIVLRSSSYVFANFERCLLFRTSGIFGLVTVDYSKILRKLFPVHMWRKLLSTKFGVSGTKLFTWYSLVSILRPVDIADPMGLV